MACQGTCSGANLQPLGCTMALHRLAKKSLVGMLICEDPDKEVEHW